jgi:hypothetical protein
MKTLSLITLLFAFSAFAEQSDFDRIKSLRSMIDRIRETEKYSPGNFNLINKEMQQQLIKESIIPNTRTYDRSIYTAKQQALSNMLWFIEQSRVYKAGNYLERQQFTGAVNWSKLFDFEKISQIVARGAELGAIREHESKGTKPWFEPTVTAPAPAPIHD